MTYPDYIDLETGRTLVCQPGQTYNVSPASGNVRSAGTEVPNDGRFAINSEVKKKSDPGDESSPGTGRRVPKADTAAAANAEEANN